MNRLRICLGLAAVFVLLLIAGAQQAAPLRQQRGGGGAGGPAQTLAERTAGMEKREGFFNFYWDAQAGKIWLEIDKWESEFLYVDSLPAGLGSNDIGSGV